MIGFTQHWEIQVSKNGKDFEYLSLPPIYYAEDVLDQLRKACMQQGIVDARAVQVTVIKAIDYSLNRKR